MPWIYPLFRDRAGKSPFDKVSEEITSEKFK